MQPPLLLYKRKVAPGSSPPLLVAPLWRGQEGVAIRATLSFAARFHMWGGGGGALARLPDKLSKWAKALMVNGRMTCCHTTECDEVP